MIAHSHRLERWLGTKEVESVSKAMRDFYWPVALHGVPGNIRIMPGGDFSGDVRVGSEASALDRADDMLKSFRNEQRARIARHRIYGSHLLASHIEKRFYAFSNLSSLIAARTGGKGCDVIFQKTGVASNAIGNSNDLWTRAGQPTTGAAAAAAAGGTVPTSATAGALGFVNAVQNANTSHFVTGQVLATVVSNTLLLYDRIFAVAKTMNSTATEAVTGVPTRYTSTTTTAADYIGGNFVFPANPTTVLAGTAHNWTVCTYTDQGANTAQTIPSAVGVSACVVGGIDLAAGGGSWFMPLASADTGIKALTQMQCSAAVATGTIDFVIGHPIAWLACPVANLVCTIDGINTAFNLVTIFDNACLSFIEVSKPATTATSYAGQITTVSE